MDTREDFELRGSIARFTAALLLASLPGVAAAAPVDIDGGASWGGWTYQGNATDVGLWGSGSTTRSYDLYTAAFTSDGSLSSSGGTQVRADAAPEGFAAGTYSTEAFASGNRIYAIGLDFDGSANGQGSTFVQFGLAGSDFSAASALGADDGRVSLSTWGHAGDFSVWLDGESGNGPSNLAVLTTDGTAWGGEGTYTSFPGGSGSGVSYDYAFRQFESDEDGGGIQLFFDLTAMEALYGSGGDHYIANLWSDGPGSVGTIGAFTVAMYSADAGYANASEIVFASDLADADEDTDNVSDEPDDQGLPSSCGCASAPGFGVLGSPLALIGLAAVARRRRA